MGIVLEATLQGAWAMQQEQRAIKITLVLLLATGIAACGERDSAPVEPVADTLYRNGRIYTVDAAMPWAQALAIKDGLIVYVGSNELADAEIGPGTVVVDLQGRMMMPAFQDSHVHPVSSGIEASACDLNGLDGVEEYRQAIAAFAAANPGLPWILGGGWSMSVFGPGAMPDRRIIDALVPDRPVFLSSQDGHTGWANSVALQIAGITNDTRDPADGRIDRDPQTGEAIGSLQEGAMRLVTAHIPPTSLSETINGLRYSVQLLNSLGITAVQDASVNEQSLQAYAALQNSGELSLRVVASLRWDREQDMQQLSKLMALREQYSNGLIDARTVKIMQDGVMENYTASLLEPYLVPSRTRGISMLEPEFLKQVVMGLDAAGFQVHFHAIGDAAIRQSLDAIEYALVNNGQLGRRHHISHLQLIDPADIPRFVQLNVIANFQPLWAFADSYITDLTIPFIGTDRARWLYPIKTVLDTGATLAFGSDWSVSSANPFHQIETAILRQDSNDSSAEIFIAEERIDLASAIKAFTLNAAFVNRLDEQSGSIKVGKLADLIVLDKNLFEIPAQELSNTQVLLTLFAGKAVHGDL
jgi:predicted amidohydrolase YtcJ